MNKELILGLETGFIDESISSNKVYRPSLLSNNYLEGTKVLSTLEDELRECDSFFMSVAFVTMGGIEPLLQTLKELNEKGIRGQILTTNYLMFSEPKAIRKLHSLENIEIKMYDTERSKAGFHTKGYIFQSDELYRIIIGSSNLTSKALTVNHEWNTRFVSTEQGEMAKSILDEFQSLWNSEYSFEYSSFIDSYETQYKVVQEQKRIAAQQATFVAKDYYLTPNTMQSSFISNLKDLIDQGAKRALLISATGTGKTYAAAFAMRELGFKRILFLVHRLELAKQALRSFKKIMDPSISMGIVGSGYREYDCDIIFGMVPTLRNNDHLYELDPNQFECIIIDEAHHSASNSHLKVMQYFQPQLFLGMTATPERTKEDENIFELFDYNIAYEIRLQQALEEDLLCPFHYFGIQDLQIEGHGDALFSELTSDERVRHIIKEAEYYGHSGDQLKGLIFCSSIKECKELSRKFNELGFHTIALDGSVHPSQRAKAFEQLASDEDPLEYIFSVDVLNEGVDIVEVNQVIMLRPTQSPIVFVQQLGRGLRKAKNKEYVVILDFIGNYNNNFMIPIALSGDRTYNKDNVRRYVLEGGRVIPGASSIHFDEVSRKRIFESIDNADFSDLKLIRESYRQLKNKLGRIPNLIDFDHYGEIDILRIFEKKSLGSYYKFLEKYEEDYTVRLSELASKYIEFISRKFVSGKRVHELLLLKILMDNEDHLQEKLSDALIAYGKELTDLQWINIKNIMTNEFPTGGSKKTYSMCIFLDKNDCRDENYFQLLQNKDFKIMVEELIEYGMYRYKMEYKEAYQNTDFVLYKKYTYEDICRLLNWKHGEVPLNIGGYKFDKETKTFPVFINYDKSENISDTIKYEDHFTSNQTLVAISKSGRKIDSDDVQNFIHAKERGISVELFVRKNKDDKGSKEFYYLGPMHIGEDQPIEFTMPNTNKTAVELHWTLDIPVRTDIYDYIVKE